MMLLTWILHSYFRPLNLCHDIGCRSDMHATRTLHSRADESRLHACTVETQVRLRVGASTYRFRCEKEGQGFRHDVSGEALRGDDGRLRGILSHELAMINKESAA